MRTRFASLLTVFLLAFGVVACDDTADGVGEDVEDIEEGAGDAGEELEDAGEELEDE